MSPVTPHSEAVPTDTERAIERASVRSGIEDHGEGNGTRGGRPECTNRCTRRGADADARRYPANAVGTFAASLPMMDTYAIAMLLTSTTPE